MSVTFDSTVPKILMSLTICYTVVFSGSFAARPNCWVTAPCTLVDILSGRLSGRKSVVCFVVRDQGTGKISLFTGKTGCSVYFYP